MDQDVTLSTQEMISKAPATENRVGDAIVELLIQRIGKDRYEMWFAGPNSIREEKSKGQPENCAIVVAADNSFSLNRIKSTFGSEVRTVVDHVCGPHFDILYRLVRARVKPGLVEFTESTTASVSASAKFAVQSQLPLSDEETETPSGKVDANLPNLQEVRPSAASLTTVESSTSFTASPNSLNTPSFNTPNSFNTRLVRRSRDLKSFHFGAENRLAEASVAQLWQHPGQYSPFFVYGPTGSGKTHLLESIQHEFRQRLRFKRCVMLSAEQFTGQFLSSLRGGEGLPVFRRKYRDLDLLVIDDIQFLAGKKATVNEFYHTIEILVRAGKQVVLSADRPAMELGLLSGDFGSRLHASLSCPLRYCELSGRIEIAKRFCSERNIQLAPAVIELVCDRLPGDIRRLSGAINRLHAYGLSVGGTAINCEIAEVELSDLFSSKRSPNVSLSRIESAVCEVCGIKPIELKSSKRHKSISTARMLAMYLSRQHTTSAFSEIGQYFGGRSHSTVIAAQKKVARWLEQNEGVALPHASCLAKEIIDRLENNLRVG